LIRKEEKMKFISSREIRSNPARLWEVTGNDESVITVNGKPRAIVVAVGEDLEETLASLRRARAFNALEKIRISAREKGLETLSDQEIEQEITWSRAGR
jgi:antitoxin (DNA-binding transcriptional repressor) of toxin-antitoxin stability system